MKGDRGMEETWEIYRKTRMVDVSNTGLVGEIKLKICSPYPRTK